MKKILFVLVLISSLFFGLTALALALNSDLLFSGFAPDSRLYFLKSLKNETKDFLTLLAAGKAKQKSVNIIKSAKKFIKKVKGKAPEILGPAGCKSAGECKTYCTKNPTDCTAWCGLNKEVCDKYSVKAMPQGVPGSPCTKDGECLTGLCLDYKCSEPTPDNLAKKADFQLPGNCSSMEDCGQYCAKSSDNSCLDFCKKLPSLCTDFDKIRAKTAPTNCQSCLTCNSKDCILACTDKCYAYMPVQAPNINSLKESIVFQRNYQEPIKAVWEPGPAFNRIGLDYFIDDYKDLGINTYSISPKYQRQDKKLVHSVDHTIGEGADKEKIANIIKAKKAGLQIVLVAHDLYDMFPDVTGKRGGINFDDYYDDIEETALKWAKIAEDYKVEYFAPISELEFALYENGYSAEKACSITNGLYKKIIPKVREIFNGKIYCRVGGMDAKFGCMDFSDCDIFGFTYGFSGKNYKSNFEAEFKVGEELSQKYGKPYIMAEAFMLLVYGNTLSDCAKLHRAGIQAYKDIAKNGVGYTFMGLIQNDPINKNGCYIKGTELVNDYRSFFKWMDK